MKVWCAADMHAPEAWMDDRWNIFTGAVIAADSAPRETGSTGTRVLNAILEDRTGVILRATPPAAGPLHRPQDGPKEAPKWFQR